MSDRLRITVVEEVSPRNQRIDADRQTQSCRNLEQGTVVADPEQDIRTLGPQAAEETRCP